MTLEGIVVAALPQYGLYSVTAKATAAGTGLQYLCTAPVSTGAAGTFMLQAPVAGQSVLFHVRDDASRRGYIMCSGSVESFPERFNNPWTSYYSIEREAVSAFSETSYTLQGMLPVYSDMQASYFATGVDDDIYQGDTEIRSINGTAGIRVTDTMLTLRGSALSFIDMSELTNAIRVVGDTIARHTLVTEDVCGPFYNVHNVAFSEREAFGCIGQAAAFKEDPRMPYMVIRDGTSRDDRTGLITGSRMPLFRLQEIEGPAVGGREFSVVAPKPGAPFHDETTEPIVLAKSRADFCGSLSSCSAAGIMSIKTPAICAISQSAYGDSAEGNPAEDLRTETAAGRSGKYREPDEASRRRLEEVRERRESDPAFSVDNASILRIIELLTSGSYADKLIGLLHRHHLAVSSDDTLKGITGSSDYSRAIGGGCLNDGYPLPQAFKLTDPVTGEARTYYCSSSFISQEPDGSILICDGYGSEIRMSRGNIYISPALDLRIRSGRDVNSLAGGHQAFVSNRSCTMGSTGADVYVTASGDGGKVNIYGGNVGLKADSCLTVTSRENTAVTGSGNVLLGLVSPDGDSDGANKKPPSGRLVIDAGHKGASSRVLIRGPEVQLEASSRIVEAVDDTSTGSVMQFTASGLQVNAPVVQLASGVLVDCSGSEAAGTFTVEAVEGGHDSRVTVAQASRLFCIKAGGSAIIDADGGHLAVNGSVTALGNVSCELVAAVSPEVASLDSKSYSDMKKDLQKSIDDVSIKPVRGLELVQAYSIYDKPPWSDLNLRVCAIPYPVKYDGMYEIASVPAMLWQHRAYSEGLPGTSMWRVEPLQSEDPDTAEEIEYYPYPGRLFWKDGVITGAGKGLDETLRVETDYIVNITKGN